MENKSLGLIGGSFFLSFIGLVAIFFSTDNPPRLMIGIAACVVGGIGSTVGVRVA